MTATTVSMCGVEVQAANWWVSWVRYLAACDRRRVELDRAALEMGATPEELPTQAEYWRKRQP